MKKVKVHAALLAVGIIYGANYSIAKSLMPQFIGPNGFILLRIAGALLLFLIIQQFWVREKIASFKDYGYLALCAFFGVAVNMLCFFNGLSLTSPINASVIMTVNPILVLVFSALLLREKVQWIKITGILLGMAGAVLQIFDPFGVSKEVAGINWQGDLLVFINAGSYAVYLVMVKPLMKKYHAFTVVMWTFTFGLLMVLPFGWREVSAAAWSELNLQVLWRLSFVIFGTTFLAYLLNAWALRYVNSSVVGAYIYVQPLLASLFAVLLAGYQANVFMLVYALLIFGGVYLVSIKKSNKTTPING
ncbi:EamA family transporter [bacterium]|nr:EamA family transporter [bacterium]